MTAIASILHHRTRRMAVRRRRTSMAGDLGLPSFARQFKYEPHQEDRRNVRASLWIALTFAILLIWADVLGWL